MSRCRLGMDQQASGQATLFKVEAAGTQAGYAGHGSSFLCRLTRYLNLPMADRPAPASHLAHLDSLGRLPHLGFRLHHALGWQAARPQHLRRQVWMERVSMSKVHKRVDVCPGFTCKAAEPARCCWTAIGCGPALHQVPPNRSPRLQQGHAANALATKGQLLHLHSPHLHHRLVIQAPAKVGQLGVEHEVQVAHLVGRGVPRHDRVVLGQFGKPRAGAGGTGLAAVMAVLGGWWSSCAPSHLASLSRIAP